MVKICQYCHLMPFMLQFEITQRAYTDWETKPVTLELEQIQK